MTHNSLRLAHVWLDEYKVSVVSHCSGGAFCASLACVSLADLHGYAIFSGLLTRAHAVVVLIRSFLNVMLQQQSSSVLCAGPH